MNPLEDQSIEFYRSLIENLARPISYIITEGPEFLEIGGLLGYLEEFQYEELNDNITPRDLKCYILKEDLVKVGVTSPKRGDKIRQDADWFTVTAVNSQTKSMGGTILCYIMTIRRE